MATLSTDAPISPLRQRMQHDMLMRGLGSHTQQDYVRHVRRFAAFLGRSPDTATPEDIRRFQLDQHENGVGPATINGTVSALRFLFTVTLKRRDLARALVVMRYQRKLPDVLSVEEAARLLEAAPGIKYKAALGVAYGAGLRVSEVAHLKVDDVDSTRMLLRVEQGKGRRDRNAMLSPQLLELLRLWWREGRRRGVMLPHGWLFPGRSCTDSCFRRACVERQPTCPLPTTMMAGFGRCDEITYSLISSLMLSLTTLSSWLSLDVDARASTSADCLLAAARRR